MLSSDEALAIVGLAAQPMDTETIGPSSAHGRVLAKPVIAAIDSLRADVLAMDGYAVRDTDLRSLPGQLVLVRQSANSPAIAPGEEVQVLEI